jgi:hypothetical protein
MKTERGRPKGTEVPRTYVRGIYPLLALERLSPKRGIRYSSTDQRPWNPAKGIERPGQSG